MKKNFVLIFLFLYSCINAQIAFEKGYFISNNGTKTECLIKNSDWYNNPSDFKYKISENDTDIKTETIATVKEFGIENNATYKRTNVKIDISDNRLENISTTKNPIWKNEVLFLKVIVQGKANLYHYINKEISRFFYETADIPLEQLVYKEYLLVDDNTSAKTTEENNYYKQQLYNNVKNENISQNEIKRLEYKTDVLKKYFLKYNNADAATVEKYTNNSTTKSIFHLKVVAGASSSSFKIDGAETSGYQNSKYDNKIEPKFGLEAEYTFPFNKNKWSVFMNLFYQKYEDSQDHGLLYSVNNSQHVEHPSTVKYSGLDLPIGVRYYFFLNKNSKIFINGAYNITLGTKFTYESKFINLDGKGQGNFACGLGYNFKNKISSEIRLNASKNFLNNYMIYTTYYNTIDLLLSYSIL